MEEGKNMYASRTTTPEGRTILSFCSAEAPTGSFRPKVRSELLEAAVRLQAAVASAASVAGNSPSNLEE